MTSSEVSSMRNMIFPATFIFRKPVFQEAIRPLKGPYSWQPLHRCINGSGELILRCLIYLKSSIDSTQSLSKFQ